MGFKDMDIGCAGFPKLSVSMALLFSAALAQANVCKVEIKSFGNYEITDVTAGEKLRTSHSIDQLVDDIQILESQCNYEPVGKTCSVKVVDGQDGFSAVIDGVEKAREPGGGTMDIPQLMQTLAHFKLCTLERAKEKCTVTKDARGIHTSSGTWMSSLFDSSAPEESQWRSSQLAQFTSYALIPSGVCAK